MQFLILERSAGTQLVSALRFLGLLEQDRPLADLEILVDGSPNERRFILKELLRDSYTLVPYDSLPRATPSMLKTWFQSYPITGNTLRKAISFYVNAAKEAETPMATSVKQIVKSRKSRSISGDAEGNRRIAQPHLPLMFRLPETTIIYRQTIQPLKILDIMIPTEQQ